MQKSQSRRSQLDPGTRAPDTQSLLLWRFWRAASGFWQGPGARQTWLLTAFLLTSILLQLAIQYRLNFWGRDFFDAFGRRDEQALRSQALMFLPLAGMSALLLWRYFPSGRAWRSSVAGARGSHTSLSTVGWPMITFSVSSGSQVGEDQNPEYRLAEDTEVSQRTIRSVWSSVCSTPSSAPGSSSAFSASVGGDLTVQVFGYTMICSQVPGHRSDDLLRLAERRDGHHRPASHRRHSRPENAAEAQFRAVGFPPSRTRNVDAPLRRAGASNTFCCQDRWMTSSPVGATCLLQFMRTTMVSQGNILLAPVITWWLCTTKYLVGTMSLGEVAQVTAAFVIVQAALNWLVENYAGVADCLSSVNRVASFLIALDELDHDETAP